MNVFDHINKTNEELEKLTTRTLDALRKASYKRNVCSCVADGGHHCGDDVLTQEERDENRVMGDFKDRLLKILATREHIPNKIEAKAIRQARAKKGR